MSLFSTLHINCRISELTVTTALGYDNREMKLNKAENCVHS